MPRAARLIAPLSALAAGCGLSGAAAAQGAPMDRYGGGELYGAPRVALSSPVVPYGLRPRATAPRLPTGMRMLSWAGKADGGYAPSAPTPAHYVQPVAYAAPAAAPTYAPAHAPPSAPTARREAPRIGAPRRRAQESAAPRAPAAPTPDAGWVPFDTAAYRPAARVAVPVPVAAPAPVAAWTPPPTPASIYESPVPEPTRAPSLRRAAAPDATPTADAVPARRQGWASMPPPRGYRVAQAEQTAAPAAPYSGSGVRHYSVHRDFGIRPDATPIPPQFFTNTADLSAETNGPQPAGPDPLARRTSGGLSSAQARATAATSSDAAQ